LKAVVRADSSLNIGSGHIMRCLTLAEELTMNGFVVYFISVNQSGSMLSHIESFGYQCFEIPCASYNSNSYNDKYFDNTYDAIFSIEILKPLNIDLIIVDHYGINSIWHKMIKQYCKSIVVIDDLANRNYECNILIDQTYGRRPDEYIKLVSNKANLCLGSKYALVRKEYFEMRGKAKIKRDKYEDIKNILIFMGGADYSSLYLDIVNTIFSMDSLNLLTVNLVVGAQDDNTIDKLSSIVDDRLKIHKNISYMPRLMYESDIFIGASGSTTWERCSLYLPSLVYVAADNQKIIAKNLYNLGAILVWKDMIELKRCFQRITQSPALYHKMKVKSGKVCDAKGVYRVANKVIESLRTL